MSEITPTMELDCRGIDCPLPVLKTKKAIMKLEPGAVLKVISTDPGSVADIVEFSRKSGHDLLERSEGGGEYVFFLRKG